MHKPFIHPKIEVRPLGITKFGVFSTDLIQAGTIIEMCVPLNLPKAAVLEIENRRSQILAKIFPNPDGINKQNDILDSIKDMEIEKRLDSGALSQEDARNILFGHANVKALLDIETGCLLSGYGSLYNRSSQPNIVMIFDSAAKLYQVKLVKTIGSNVELTYLST